LNRNKLEQAKPILDTLHEEDSEDLEVHFLYGVLYTKKGSYHSAISYLLRLVDSYYSSIYMPQAVKILVYCYIKIESYDLAITLINDVLSNYYNDAQLNNMLGFAYYSQGKIKDALRVYAGILKENADNSSALNAMGYCLIDKFSRYGEGLKMCEKALVKNPDDPAVLDSVGWGYFKQGDYSKAEYFLRQAFEKIPENEVVKKHITMAVEAV
jgi:tetratricopeptide (TPR) repeat protein